MEGLIADDSEVFVQGLLRALGRHQPGMVQAEQSRSSPGTLRKGRKMEHVFLIGAVTCLVISWVYIFALKTRVRDCMTYIQSRIDKATPNSESPNHRNEGGQGSEDSGEPPRRSFEDVTKPAVGKATMNGRPKLIVGGSDGLQYLCSHCSRPFFLPSGQPPKEAVAELLHNFGEHVEREHPSAVVGSDGSPMEADKQDGN